VRWLTGNGSNPERIWKRAKTVQFMFEKEEGFPRLLNLANELNTSSASISRNLAAYEAELESVYVNQSRPENSLQ
jgi:hypothetical protein